MFKLFTIKGGKINLFGITKAMIVMIVTSGLVLAIASYFKISEEDIWKIIIAIQQHFKIEFGEDYVDQIRNNEKLLDFVAKNKVDNAIAEYQRLTGDDGVVRLPPPRYSERPLDASVCRSKECQALGGEMRLCAPWYEGCPDNSLGDTRDLTEQAESDNINKSVRNELPKEPGKFKF